MFSLRITWRQLGDLKVRSANARWSSCRSDTSESWTTGEKEGKKSKKKKKEEEEASKQLFTVLSFSSSSCTDTTMEASARSESKTSPTAVRRGSQRLYCEPSPLLATTSLSIRNCLTTRQSMLAHVIIRHHTPSSYTYLYLCFVSFLIRSQKPDGSFPTKGRVRDSKVNLTVMIQILHIYIRYWILSWRAEWLLTMALLQHTRILSLRC